MNRVGVQPNGRVSLVAVQPTTVLRLIPTPVTGFANQPRVIKWLALAPTGLLTPSRSCAGAVVMPIEHTMVGMTPTFTGIRTTIGKLNPNLLKSKPRPSPFPYN